MVKLEDGVTAELGDVLARAGEGTLYDVVGHPNWVAKMFHPSLKDLQTKIAKVKAMTASQPPGAVQPDGFVVLTWPLHVVEDTADVRSETATAGASGYIMHKVDTATAVEIHCMSNPSNRMNPLRNAPQWTKNATWPHLVNVAANLCLAVGTAHRVNAVIGDFQERNILVSNTTRVTLVDCDSMQFIDAEGHQYLCGVGRPEFTAPELARVNLRTHARDKQSDLFALAVHIHMLLMGGNHPFMRGTWTGNGEQPDALALAKAGHWAGGPMSPLHTHPLAPPVTYLPADIQLLFVRAFTQGAQDPSIRPSASEWRTALMKIQVRPCQRGAHQIPILAFHCPWCVIDDQRAFRKQQRQIAAASAPARPSTYRSHTPSSPSRPQSVAPPKRNSNTAAWLLALFFVIFAGIGIIIAVTMSDSSSSAKSRQNSRSTMPPPGAVECSSTTASPYSHSARGNVDTGCSFADNVRAEVNKSSSSLPTWVSVYDPVGRQSVSMYCSGSSLVTCTGGSASSVVVYIY